MVNLPIGAEGWDYSFDRPDAISVPFVFRYLTGAGKSMSYAELSSLTKRGIGVGVVMETSAQAALGGYAVGRYQAHSAIAARSNLGMSPETVISFAIDWDVTNTQMNTKVREFFRGVFSLLPERLVGIYGGYRAIAMAPTMGFYWQTYAWSGGRVHSRTHLYQYKNGVSRNGGTVDLNRVLKPFSVHPTPAPHPITRKGVRMLALYSGSDQIWYGDGFHARWVQYPADVAALKAGGAIELPRFPDKTSMHRVIGRIDMTNPGVPVVL